MTHQCSLCHGTSIDADGRACPYADVHRAAERFPRNPMSDPPMTASLPPKPDQEPQGATP